MSRRQQWCILAISICINLVEVCVLLLRNNESSGQIVVDRSKAEKAKLPNRLAFPTGSKPENTPLQEHAKSASPSIDEHVNTITYSNLVTTAYSTGASHRALPCTLRLNLQISAEENIEIERLIDKILKKCIDYERSRITPPSDVDDAAVVMHGKIPKLLALHKEISHELNIEFARILGQERGTHIAAFFINSPLFSCLLAERELLKGALNHTPTSTQIVTAGVKTSYAGPDGNWKHTHTVTSDDDEEFFRKRYLPLINWKEFLEN
jgi:hypothetical protein